MTVRISVNIALLMTPKDPKAWRYSGYPGLYGLKEMT